MKLEEFWTTRKAQINSQPNISTSTDPSLPSHMILEKGPCLRESAKEMAGRKDKLDEEFKLITDHTTTRINVKKDSCLVSTEEGDYYEDTEKPSSKEK